MGRKLAAKRKKRREARKHKRQGRRLNRQKRKKAKHDVKEARKVRRRGKRKAAFKEIGNAIKKGAPAVFKEIKEDIINPMKQIALGPTNLMNSFANSPGMSTMVIVGGVAVVAAIVLR